MGAISCTKSLIIEFEMAKEYLESAHSKIFPKVLLPSKSVSIAKKTKLPLEAIFLISKILKILKKKFTISL